MKTIKRELKNCNSVIDLGCGNNSPLCRFKRWFKIIGVDDYEISKLHDKFYQRNVRDLYELFLNKSVDAIVALDLIEHLTKEEGLELIKKMERIAKKKIIIFTPNGFREQSAFDGNPLQIHKSGWDFEEMKKLGFKVIGKDGLKYIKGKENSVRFKPIILWLWISKLTQPFVRNNPKYAYNLLCIKDSSKTVEVNKE